MPTWIEYAAEFMDGKWGATILGWFLGLISAWWSARRLARMQAEQIRTLQTLLTRFEDNFRQNLEPISDSEKDQVADARKAFIERDYEPSGQRVFWRAAKVPAAWAAAAVVSFVVAGIASWALGPPSQTGGPGWAGILVVGPFAFGWLSIALAFGSLVIFRELYEGVRQKIASEHLHEAQGIVQSLKLNERQFDHLRRWALGHAFLFLGRPFVLRRIELANIATRRSTPKLVEAQAA